MRVLYAFLLQLFHSIYAATLLVRSFWKRNSSASPQPLRAPRPRIPKHLAIVFNVDPSLLPESAQETLTESIVEAASWCRTVRIEKLTIYEEKNVLSKCIQNIRERLPLHGRDTESSESETEYPPTPPASDYSESRPLSPEPAHNHITPVTTIKLTNHSIRKDVQKRQRIHRRHPNKTAKVSPFKDLLVCLISRTSSKPAIANAATSLACLRQKFRSSKDSEYRLSVAQLDRVLEDDEGLSSPDFMIIHPIGFPGMISSPLELYGFPPWHIRLTEIHQNKPPKSRLQQVFRWKSTPPPAALDETSFRSALDEFASAEMRFGK